MFRGGGVYYLAWIIEALCYCSVNIYVLISGYFLINSKFKIKKVISLVFEVLFYSIGIYAIFCIAGQETFNIKSFLTSYLFPIICGKWWFITVYIVLYFAFPVLNKAIKAMDKKQHGVFLIVFGTILSIIPFVFYFQTDIIGLQGGYSLIWFLYLYFVAAYLRLYGLNIKKNYLYLIFYFVFSLLTALIKFMQVWIFNGEAIKSYSYTSPTVLLASICLFMFFVGLKDKKPLVSKIFSAIGGTTFGVFLIHTHNLMRDKFLWGFVKANERIGSPLEFIGYFILFVLGIFVACAIIDCIRGLLFKLIGKSKKLNAVGDKIQDKLFKNY